MLLKTQKNASKKKKYILEVLIHWEHSCVQDVVWSSWRLQAQPSPRRQRVSITSLVFACESHSLKSGLYCPWCTWSLTRSLHSCLSKAWLKQLPSLPTMISHAPEHSATLPWTSSTARYTQSFLFRKDLLDHNRVSDPFYWPYVLQHEQKTDMSRWLQVLCVWLCLAPPGHSRPYVQDGQES